MRKAKVSLPKALKPKEEFIPDLNRVWGNRFEDVVETASIQFHSHNVGSLVFVEKGSMAFQTMTESWLIPFGTITYIPPGFPHAQNAVGKGASGWALFLPLKDALKLAKRPHVIELSPLLAALCMEIVSWGDQMVNDSRNLRLMRVFIDELRNARESSFLNIPFPKTPNLRKICAWIVDHPEDMRGIGYWSKQAILSRRSFSRIFPRETGLTFVRWRQRVKLYSSVQMLSFDKSITEVALDLGYQNPSTFIAIFRKQFGVSPLRYMKSEKT